MIIIPILLLILLTIFLAWYLLSKDKGEREPTSALWAALGFGFLGVIIAVFAENLLVDESVIKQGGAGAGMLGNMLLVGIIEEAAKFFPLAWFIRNKRYFNEHTDGILYFALAGAGFGLPEDILYTMTYGSEVGFGRAVITPFFHSATTAFVGYYLIRAKIRNQSIGRPLAALGGMMLLHGLYDYGLGSKVGVLALTSLVVAFGLTAALFTLGGIAKQHDQRIGLSVVGVNAYCRSCGFPNPKRKLYCQRCGKHA